MSVGFSSSYFPGRPGNYGSVFDDLFFDFSCTGSVHAFVGDCESVCCLPVCRYVTPTGCWGNLLWVIYRLCNLQVIEHLWQVLLFVGLFVGM